MATILEAAMTPRQRVYSALEFRTPDRPPRNLWALPWVDIHAAKEKAEFLVEFPDDFTAPGEVLAPGDRRKGKRARLGINVDDWGCIWEVAQDGVIGEVKYPPLKNLSMLSYYRPPWEILQRANWDAVKIAQDRNLAGPEKFMLCGSSVRPFERMQFLCGSEPLYLELGYGSIEVRKLRDLVHDFYMKELAEWVKTGCDGISFMDDWGSQQSLLISPAMWRDFLKPLYRDYCDLIRRAGKKVFLHSDGCILDIYEDLIELGVSAVNSQLFCMDIEEIGRRCKGRITFWGEIDRQHILPFGTPEDCRSAVGRVRRALEDARGGVIAECEWGVNAPIANIRAVFDEWSKPLASVVGGEPG
jgi:hypothetical protein